jgi:hypothetical protein
MIGGALDLGLVDENRDEVRIGVGEKGKITERAGTPSRKGMARPSPSNVSPNAHPVNVPPQQ